MGGPGGRPTRWGDRGTAGRRPPTKATSRGGPGRGRARSAKDSRCYGGVRHGKDWLFVGRGGTQATLQEMLPAMVGADGGGRDDLLAAAVTTPVTGAD